MRAFSWCYRLAVTSILTTATLTAQEPSLLRDLPAVQVVIDWVQIPSSDAAADSLRQRVIVKLRAAGVPITEKRGPETLGAFIFAPQYAFEQPTFLVSLNMVPDGCAFVASFFLRMPVAVSGYKEKVPLSVYASRSYIYSVRWADHDPVLNFLDDFIEAWRSANKR